MSPLCHHRRLTDMITYEEFKKMNHDGTLFDYIVSEENVWHAYKQTQKGKPKHKRPAVRFRMNETANLKIIQAAVASNSWTPKGYYKFEIHDPKHRIIYAPAYEDKIVHHMLYQVLRVFYEKQFIHDSYSCIREKGNQRAVYRLQDHLRKAKRNYEEPHLVKIDIKKFFPTIPKNILKNAYRKKIRCERTFNLICIIIDSSPSKRGLPLGCVTSQLSANVIMNEYDQYAKRELKVKYFLRYADDIFIITRSKEEARRILKESEQFISENLNMGFSQGKCFVGKLNTRPVVGLGYKIFPTHIMIKSINKRRIKRKTRKELTSDIERSLMAYNSYLSVANSFLFANKYLPKHLLLEKHKNLNLATTLARSIKE